MGVSEVSANVKSPQFRKAVEALNGHFPHSKRWIARRGRVYVLSGRAAGGDTDHLRPTEQQTEHTLATTDW